MDSTVAQCSNGSSSIQSEDSSSKMPSSELLSDLAGFKFVRVLNERPENKVTFLEGRFPSKGDAPAILVLEKTPIEKEKLQALLEATKLKPIMQNDIYSTYECFVDQDLNTLFAKLIFPATAKHIAKYESSTRVVMEESPAVFRVLTSPFVEKNTFNPEWVYNCLEHKSETETILLEDPDPVNGFMLMPDYKWNQKQVEDLYMLAIVHRRDLRSIRELNGTHLPMLKDLLSKCKKAIFDKYGVPAEALQAYLHYQPSYYHLHVHFTHIQNDSQGPSVGHCHLLSTIISNLTLDPAYYTKATLAFNVKENSELCGHYRSSKIHFTSAERSAVVRSELLDGSDNLLLFFEGLGKPKHEPWGEHWNVTYAESAWRMAIFALCLPQHKHDRKRLAKMALSSAFTGMGSCIDDKSLWGEKVHEVCSILKELLPAHTALDMLDLYTTHAAIRRGVIKTEEEATYRKLLEFEETFLLWEELKKEEASTAAETRRVLFAKMTGLGFNGTERLEVFGDSTELEAMLAFFLNISSLCSLKRTGWVRKGVKHPEHVAGHMYRMAVMAMVLEEDREDRRVQDGSSVILTLIHDMAECFVGDITPDDPVTPEEKHKKEMEAMKVLVKKLPSALAVELYTSLQRYEDRCEDDAEALITFDLDKFDMILQAFEYEQQDKARGRFLEDFFTSTKGVFKTPIVRKMVEQLVQKREAFFKASG